MSATSPSGRGWRGAYILGAVVAFAGIGGMVFDIVLSMVPGWGPGSVPAGTAAWFVQFASNPWLGLRNLDLLNVTISLVTLPMYVALFGMHREEAPGLAALGVVLVGVGTAIFVSANAALPMLALSGRHAAATDPVVRAGLAAAADALLARGAHGSAGAYPGFLVSEIGTMVVSFAMLRGRVFGRVTAWLGIVGTAVLMVYTTAYTFGPGTGALMMAIAIPGGLVMIAWQAIVGARLLRAGAQARVA